jgi:hypothetical protein
VTAVDLGDNQRLRRGLASVGGAVAMHLRDRSMALTAACLETLRRMEREGEPATAATAEAPRR